MSDYRVGLIDSNEVLRVGRRLVINSQPNMRVIFEEPDPVRAIKLAPDYLVDIIVAGPSHYQIRGAKFLEKLCQELSKAGNNCAVVAYDAFTTDKLRYEAIRAGAQEFLGLDSNASTLLATMQHVVKRDFLVDPMHLKALGSQFGFLPATSELEEKLSKLSEAQTKIVESFLAGMNDSAIAKQFDAARTRITTVIESLVIAGQFTSRNQLALALFGGTS